MSQSLAKNTLHLVFSTKDRRIFLRDKEREELHSYITGILKNKKSPLIEVNSVGDHIHILYAQSKNLALAKVVEQVKSSSSGWLKEQHRAYSGFAWQAGYGAFREPLIKWEGYLLEAIGPYFKARAKRQYPSVLPERATPKDGPSASSPKGCTEKRPGAALAPQSQPMRDAPASPPCPRPLLSATNALPI